MDRRGGRLLLGGAGHALAAASKAGAHRLEDTVGRRRLGQILGATSAAAVMMLSAPPAAAGDHKEGRGATVEEFVCYKSTGGDRVRVGTGKIITTPSGNSQLVCTGKPLS